MAIASASRLIHPRLRLRVMECAGRVRELCGDSLLGNSSRWLPQLEQLEAEDKKEPCLQLPRQPTATLRRRRTATAATGAAATTAAPAAATTRTRILLTSPTLPPLALLALALLPPLAMARMELTWGLIVEQKPPQNHDSHPR
jgi:hypothetical protein